MTRWRMLMTGLVTTSLLMAGLGGRADAGSGARRVRIEGTITSGEPTVTAIACDAAGHCVAHATSPHDWTGGLVGTSESRYALAVDPSTGMASIQSFDLFTGHVDGCGDGSMTLSGTVTRRLDSPGTGTLEVVGGSGSGALAGITGRGTFDVTPTGPTTASSTFSLLLRCERPAQE